MENENNDDNDLTRLAMEMCEVYVEKKDRAIVVAVADDELEVNIDEDYVVVVAAVDDDGMVIEYVAEFEVDNEM